MKKLLALLLLAVTLPALAQTDHTWDTLAVHTNAVCDMCQKTIETEMLYEKGVKSVKVDLASNTIHIDYDAKKTDGAKLRTAITKLGYAADDLPPDMKARKDLPSCCQKEGCGMPPTKH